MKCAQKRAGRPVKELKGFRRIERAPLQSSEVKCRTSRRLGTIWHQFILIGAISAVTAWDLLEFSANSIPTAPTNLIRLTTAAWSRADCGAQSAFALE
jgi:hypothetical protein